VTRLAPVLGRTAIFLAGTGFLLREWAGGATAGTGLNLAIHLLPWVALALWFGGKALEGGAVWRFTGMEFAVLAFAVASLGSVLGASYRPAALEHAFAYLSFGLFLLFAVQALGPRALLGLLLPTLFTLAAYALVQYFVLLPSLPQDGMSEELRRRVASLEVFATFIGPNALAGFLVLLLPLAAGVLLDRRRDGPWGWGPPAAALGLGLWAIGLTGSLGGGVALAAGAAVFATLALTRERKRGLAVGAAAAVAGVAVLLVLFTPLLGTLAARSHSMHVRRVYWQAAGRAFAESPVLGKGLDNFQEHYFRLKSDVQQETMKVHNDYLELLAETGVLGFAAFAAVLALGLRRAFARRGAETIPAETGPPWLELAAAGVSFGAAFRSLDPALATALFVVWGGFFLSARRRPASGPPVFARIGLAAGLAALLVHMTVDFDLYEMGVAAALYAALALAAVLGPAPADVPLPRAACAAAAGVLLLVAVPLLLVAAPRAMAADDEARIAGQLLRSHERSAGPERDATMRISEAIRLTQASQENNPFDPEGYELHALARFHEWDLLRGNARDERALQELEGIVLVSLANAIALRPDHAPYHFRKAHYHMQFRLFHLGDARREGRRTLALAQAAEHLRRALDHQRRAVELYPTFSKNRYALARLLDAAGEAAEARPHYAAALDLSALAARELENLDRLQLAPWERARALKRVDRHAEAQETLARWLAPHRSRPRETLELIRKRPESLGIPADELDEVVRPAVEEALDSLSK
jgi:O-antigen ligase/tetratricopeptide (TPR) repeat protein